MDELTVLLEDGAAIEHVVEYSKQTGKLMFIAVK